MNSDALRPNVFSMAARPERVFPKPLPYRSAETPRYSVLEKGISGSDAPRMVRRDFVTEKTRSAFLSERQPVFLLPK